ncbi:hypothetical protein DICPUDRAFT_147571 [Dictyostelium purpureum]|uniref:Transmembrane protein n=1 Tax=Dictyostelium purpureum TaxID=5786 RepID=F0Z8U6_DICPU|nr:uncharacterized protein DICPUDRAFT_147571 [Dictyostelium purpureum]EGC39637.1 hypothetical protein DICPUDRAFT_147571 [Dictyostelium purpureum]|eukprot:XP_003283858.1 hypothetical protein DICPUDRAFT_147571 [Dictyostelium purpureum]
MDRSTNNSRPRFSVTGNSNIGLKRPANKTPGRASIQQPSYYSSLASNTNNNNTKSSATLNNNNNNNNNFNDITPIKHRPSISGNSSRPNLNQTSSATLPTFLNEGTNSNTSSTNSAPTLNNTSNFFNKFFNTQSQPTQPSPPINNINNQSDYEMMDYPNDSYISNTSTNKTKLNTTPPTNNINLRNSNNILNTPNSLNNSGIYYNNTPAKTRKKPFTEKIRDVVNYPIDKLDEFQEVFLSFNHSKFYNTWVYGLALFLNLMLLAYSIDLLNNFFAFLLFVASIGNTIYYFSSTKTSYLYRYDSTEFKSPNMSIAQIESPTGSVDNVVVLKSWEPKFFPRVIFTLFSPLHVFIMVALAGPEFDSFVIYTLISVVICFGLHYLNEKYNQYILDQNIIFSQLCQEYNHFMRVIPETREKSSQTPDYR